MYGRLSACERSQQKHGAHDNEQVLISGLLIHEEQHQKQQRILHFKTIRKHAG